MATDMPTDFSRSSYKRWNPSLWDFPHSESPTLKAPIRYSAAGIPPARKTNTSLRAPLVWTYEQMNTSIHQYSAVRFSSLGRQF